jgi:hypothetical protein
MKKIKKSIALISICLLFAQTNIAQTNSNNDILGYSFLSQITGQWSGPVTSATPAGDFPIWYVDFRPVSASQVSQFSLLDSQTVNNISFLIVKHDNELRLAMRTEGCFNKKCCVTYEVLDSVSEANGYYRFSDFQGGNKRAYTEFRFTESSFVMDVYTNIFNKLDELKLHTHWEANLGSKEAANQAIEYFDYPQAIMVRDFTDAFKNMKESIFFTLENDPYSSTSQPYVGSVTVDISISENLKLAGDHELFLLLTTESLFEGLKYDSDKKKSFSKYIFLPINTRKYTIRNVHPGTYYLYSYDDINQDKQHLSGDYMSSDIENIIEVKENSDTKVHTNIDIIIP